MDYSLNTLTNDQLEEVFDKIPEEVLRDFLAKNQKHFEKSRYIKGYRINKLPKTLIYKLFSEEILSVANTVLERNIISFIKLNFKNTCIETIMDSFTGDVLNTALSLENEVISAGLTVSPAIILLISNLSITKEEKLLIDGYHKLCLETQNSAINKTKIEVEEKNNQKFIDLLNDYDKIKEELLSVRKETATLKNELISKESIIKHKEQEVYILNSRVKVADTEVDKLNGRLGDYNEKVHNISEQAKEIKSLKTQNEELLNTISKLSVSVLTPDSVTKMCAETLDDLKQESIGSEQLVQEAKMLFSEDESVIGAWFLLSDKEKEKMERIIRLMNENTITRNDIEILENVESYILIKYMIVKSLIVVFYKYLELNISQKKIVDKF